MGNINAKSVEDFGREWSAYDQKNVSQQELLDLFKLYFKVFPWETLPENAVGFDLGCGSGRWDKFVAPRVGKLHCIDASEAALTVARRALVGFDNCEFHHASVDSIPLPDNSMDFGYSLGVLHHVPDTAAGIKSCADKLKPGAPLLVYIYYAFDNRPAWFRTLWKISDAMRKVISELPHSVKFWFTSIFALVVYWPLARLAFLLEKFGFKVDTIPLYEYRQRSFYTMRTDALDRFGSREEHRFTAAQIRQMMERAGLEQIRFPDEGPFWSAVGTKRA